ncbi:MAG: hypothetical protein QOJ92_239 [Frankiales bacterium]|nr:hypothetical protein [Frankiales bacterium]
MDDELCGLAAHFIQAAELLEHEWRALLTRTVGQIAEERRNRFRPSPVSIHAELTIAHQRWESARAELRAALERRRRPVPVDSAEWQAPV